MKVAVVGAGAVGARAVRQLASSPEVDHVDIVDDDAARAEAVVAAVAEPDRVVAALPSRCPQRWS